MKRKIFAAILVLCLLVSLVPTACGESGVDVTLASAEDFLRFARACARENYSKGRVFLLVADLDLTGTDYISVPFFAGHFNGNGHTIRGLSLAAEGSRLGLFRQISIDGVVENLFVRGTVQPGGTQEYIGGIAGVNEGQILSCYFNGTIKGIGNIGGIVGYNAKTGRILSSRFEGCVLGEHQVGGIAGLNDGLLFQCENAGRVNTEEIVPSVKPSLDLSRFSLTDFDVSYLSQDDFVNLSNISGIAGENNGIVQSCRNTGEIGYKTTGYNIGGIVGKNSGFVDTCSNEGLINGRRDVGGIVGQSIPYAVWNFTNEKVDELKDAMSYMHYLLDNSIETVDSGAEEVFYHLLMMNSYTDQAIKALVRSIENIGDSSITVTAPAVPDVQKPYRDPLEDLINGIAEGDAGRQLEELAKGPTFGEIASSIGEAVKTADVSVNLNVDTQSFKTAVHNMFGEAAYLGATVANSVTSLAQDINDITRQMGYIMNILSSIASDTGDLVTRKDLSLEKAYEVNEGAVARCMNAGPVRAETNAGGIVGSIGFELAFDMEDSLNTSELLTLHAEQTLFAVIRACRNSAEVVSRSDAAGGISGRMDAGAAIDCIASGRISAQNGDYAGGIAGLSKGTISRCWSRVMVEGRRYVGGVAGLGKDLMGNRTWTQISRASEYQGAVAGWAEGTVSYNQYVDSWPEGVDGVSRAGQADLISSEQFLSQGSAPSGFETVTVTFYVEDTVVQTLSVPFGGTVEELPEVPNRGSAAWEWNPFDRSHIFGDTEVRGSYISPRTAIASGETVPLFLVEGQFYEYQTLTVLPFDGTESHPKAVAGYTLSVNDYSGDLTVRMRTQRPVDVYQARSGSEPEKISTRSDGQYLVFSLPNDGSLVCVEREEHDRSRLVVLIAAVLLEIILIILLIRKHKHRKQKKGSASEEPQ